jgi:hypothetical protein
MLGIICKSFRRGFAEELWRASLCANVDAKSANRRSRCRDLMAELREMSKRTHVRPSPRPASPQQAKL